MPVWILATQWVSRLVLVLLAGLSVWSVSIMLERRRYFQRLRQKDFFEQARALLEKKDASGLRAWIDASPGLHSGTLRAAIAAPQGSIENIDRAVRAYLSSERNELERGLTTLATLGSNAPFIGLFGTVLGIIQAFGVLSSSQASPASVMSGISEALVATAVGLFVAIPAVVAYNVFTRQLRVVLVECESLKDLFLSRQSGETA